MDTNFYWYFGVKKDSTVSVIKLAYKRISAEMNSDGLQFDDAIEQKKLLTYMYEVMHLIFFIIL